MNIWEKTEIDVAKKICKEFAAIDHHMPLILITDRKVATKEIEKMFSALAGATTFSIGEWQMGRTLNKKVFMIISTLQYHKQELLPILGLAIANSLTIKLEPLAKNILRSRTGLKVGLLS